MNTSSHFCIFSNILLSQWNSPTNRLTVWDINLQQEGVADAAESQQEVCVVRGGDNHGPRGIRH